MILKNRSIIWANAKRSESGCNDTAAQATAQERVPASGSCSTEVHRRADCGHEGQGVRKNARKLTTKRKPVHRTGGHIATIADCFDDDGYSGLLEDDDPSSLCFVQSQVSLGFFQLFLEEVKENDVQVINENVSGFLQLGEKFGFRSLFSTFSTFIKSPSCKDSANAGPRNENSSLENGLRK
jgi:hypothetical protein